MIHGIINVYKEKGYTSHDVVAKLRGILKQKKIGHTGTLDPDAEGVLPACLGKATKVCDLLTEKDKVYEAVLLLGKTTDTQDAAGAVLKEQDVLCAPEQVREAIMDFVGSYEQIPPMYSALKVNGRKLCDLARAGIEVERKARNVTIFSIQIQELSLPRVRMEIHCSKGTYIRTLCHDIGEKLGCGGCMESLLRTRVAEFTLADARKLEEIEIQVQKVREKFLQTESRQEDLIKSASQAKSVSQIEFTQEDLRELVKSIDCVFRKYPKSSVKQEFAKLLYNGNALQPEWMTEWKESYKETMLRVYDKNQLFAGIYQWDEQKRMLKPVKIFMA